jgi:Peptidase family M1 domain/Peptidase M1 N-terminal domain/Immune inhibitor A peptidase M6
MARRCALVVALMACLTLMLGGVTAAAPPEYSPGAPGVGDPYFPLAGNGGYDVDHYRLDIAYDPDTDVLSGVATIRARATQDLSSFNLDLDGLEVRSVTVNGRTATWSRDGGELTIMPVRGIREGSRFITVVEYDGVPETIEDPALGPSGFIHTDDGALVVGEPEVAATWFPVNDHPSDKASYTFRITVPDGLEAVANGVLRNQRTRGDSTTWTWMAREPMASYLATSTIGEFDLRAYREDGIRYWDALDPDVFVPPEPRTGDQFALSQVANLSFKRLTRTISVPEDGAQLSFWVIRDTEPAWDFMFVEAHTVGEDDWTTLDDLNGNSSQDTGIVCPFWLDLHPFLTHYQTDNGDGSCAPTGTTGEWWAASGGSDGYEQWSVDLSAYAGDDVEVSISYASDDIVQATGLYVDDIEVSTGEGSTSFEDDGDTFDGWMVPGAPEGSEPNPNDWIVGTADDTPPTVGEVAEGSLARQPEIIEFLSDVFGPYPFSAAGGIVDDAEILFALENQTRPIYSPLFFSDPVSGDAVVVHELAHQWYGDSLALERWQHIWLNEGFASYAEWLWSEREGLGTAQEIFDGWATIPADDPFWSLTIGDPGPENLFDFAVYIRGAMTLHTLRLEVGDELFFEILLEWAQTQAGGNVTTDEFMLLAEKISGQELDDLFETWLFTPEKPAGLDAAGDDASAASAAAAATLGLEAPEAVDGSMSRRELRRR